MSRQASPAVIGGFVLGAVVLIVAAIVWFGGGRLLSHRHQAVLFFPGSVRGLSVGAPVLAGGVKVGEVVDVRLQMDVVDVSVRAPVIIEIDPRKMELVRGSRDFRADLRRWVEGGVRGQLAIQSFVTGQLMVMLELHPGTPVELVGALPELPEIPTIPTPLEELSRRIGDLPLAEIVEGISSSLDGISNTVNSPQIAATIAEAQESLEEIKTLARDVREGLLPLMAKADRTLDEAKTLVRNLDARASSLSTSAEESLADARTLVRRVDGRVDPVLAAVEGAAGGAGRLFRNFDEGLGPVLESLREAGAAATAALVRAEGALGALEGAAGGDSPLGYQISGALREVSGAARSLRTLTDVLDQHPDALLRGKTRGETQGGTP
ncbi:MAG: MlaD family protein [Deferrisomatales bacterium]|nr:MlaD family protein [Deferrisomatales bacterium]